MSLKLENISRVVDGENYLTDINLNFPSGTFNVLLGNTLAGKTSLLRIIAGLDQPSAGQVTLAGNDITNIPVQKRNISMVYQQFINYPNLTVYDNIASPLKLAKVTKSEIAKRVAETAELLHITPFLQRFPLELSGGQQQRCAMARALVKDAQIILFDEPLANLDYKLREALRGELKSLFKSRNCVAIYTTTEAHEALALGGQVSLLHEGRVLQSGAVSEQYSQPVNIDAANLFNDPPMNILAGEVKNAQTHFNWLDSSKPFPLASYPHLSQIADGEYKFALRADHLSLRRQQATDVEFDAIVELAEVSASETYLHIRSGELTWVAHLFGIHHFATNTQLTLYFNLKNMMVFDPQGHGVAWPKTLKITEDDRVKNG